MSNTNETTTMPNGKKPHPLTGRSPWAGLSPEEIARRKRKLKRSQRERRERAAQASAAKLDARARRLFTPEQRAERLAEATALVASGMLLKDACAQAGIGQSQYHAWRRGEVPLGKAPALNAAPFSQGRKLIQQRANALAIRRPPPEDIEVLDVPAPRNGHRVSAHDRMDRLAALIVAVERLL